MRFIEQLIFGYIFLNVSYVTFFSLAAKFSSKRRPLRAGGPPVIKFCILIPAYKEDAVIVETAKRMAALNYPEFLFSVFIIADGLQQPTLEALNSLKVQVIEVSFQQSTKAKALNEAIHRIDQNFNAVVIADADNIFQTNYLAKLDAAFRCGMVAIQTQRVAKNVDSPYAILDAASEIMGNQIFRRGPYAVGLSSSVIGSGMAFEFNLFKEVIALTEATGGFDKVLQLAVVQRRIRIHYLEEALVFDEKIGNSVAFSHQRNRWVSAQFVYLSTYFVKGFSQLLKGNLDYFNLAILNNALLPKVLLLVLSVFLTCGAWLLPSYFSISSMYWATVTLVFSLSLLICLPRAFINTKLFSALMYMPRVALSTVLALLRIRQSNRQFIHTSHTVQKIDNPLYKAYDH